MDKILSNFAIILLLQSCTKTDETIIQKQFVEKTEIMSKSASEQVTYAQQNLKEIGTEIAKLAQNKDFITYVHNEVKKKFDNEYEVLIQDLFKNSLWRNKEEYKKIDSYLNQFKNLGGANYYPQIYIPKFQELEDNGIVSSSFGDNATEDSIVYVYYGGDSEADTATNENESYLGYVMNSVGQMVYWGMVNEEYANNNEVWIISINESVNNAGYVCPFAPNGTQFSPECPGGGGGGNDNPPPPPPGGCTGDPNCDPNEAAPFTEPFPDLGHSKVNCKIEKMIVKDGKESWLAGASEISIRAKLHTHNNRELGNLPNSPAKHYRSLQYSNYLGKLISKFKRKSIKNGTEKSVNFPVETDWQSQFAYSDPIFSDYVIFEKDNWPAHLHNNLRYGRIDTRIRGSETETWDQKYRSSKRKYTDNDYPYASGVIVNNYTFINYGTSYFDGIIRNDKIAFNFVGY